MKDDDKNKEEIAENKGEKKKEIELIIEEEKNS